MTAFTAEENNGQADINDIATYLGVTEKTVRNRLKEHGGFWIDGGKNRIKGKGKSRINFPFPSNLEGKFYRDFLFP